MSEPEKPAWQRSVERVEAERRKGVPPGVWAAAIILGFSMLFLYRTCSQSGFSLSNATIDTTPASRSGPDAVDAGYTLCKVMEGTGLTTGCEVNGWGKTVDVRVAISAAEARTLCTTVADQMRGRGFGTPPGGWKLRFLSPYSGDQPIAVCALH